VGRGRPGVARQVCVVCCVNLDTRSMNIFLNKADTALILVINA
jgi:hypothetical protein